MAKSNVAKASADGTGDEKHELNKCDQIYKKVLYMHSTLECYC